MRAGDRLVKLPFALAVGTAVAVTGVALPATAGAKPTTVKVMTRNLYLGADLVPAILAGTPGEAREAAEAVVDTNFTARAKLIAEEIRRSRGRRGPVRA